MKRTNAVMVRLDDEQSAELDRLADVVGVAGSTLAHNAVMAMLRCYRENGSLSLPLRMTSGDLPSPEGDPVLNEPDMAASPSVASSKTQAARSSKPRRSSK